MHIKHKIWKTTLNARKTSLLEQQRDTTWCVMRARVLACLNGSYHHFVLNYFFLEVCFQGSMLTVIILFFTTISTFFWALELNGLPLCMWNELSVQYQFLLQSLLYIVRGSQNNLSWNVMRELIRFISLLRIRQPETSLASVFIQPNPYYTVLEFSIKKSQHSIFKMHTILKQAIFTVL